MFETACHAKLNWRLHLLGPRADGFTELDSLVIKLPLFETLMLSPSPNLRGENSHEVGEIVFSCSDIALAALGEKNLVLRGIRAIQNIYKQLHQAPSAWPRVYVHLDKRLPYQAGLGSGSSNAAGAIRLYAQFCAESLGLPALNEAELLAAGAKIGSDVPLFLSEAPALRMQGRGEIITPCEDFPDFLRGKVVAILKPGDLSISTAEAYAAVHKAKAYSVAEFGEGWPASPYNDFERVIFAAHPKLANLHEAIKNSGAQHAGLCGSGAALFGVYTPETWEDSGQAQLEFLSQKTGCQVLHCTI